MSPKEIKQTVKEQEELIEMFDHFVDHHMGKLKGAEIRIWLALLTNVFEGTVHTTAHELAEVIGLSNNSARRALQSLTLANPALSFLRSRRRIIPGRWSPTATTDVPPNASPSVNAMRCS